MSVSLLGIVLIALGVVGIVLSERLFLFVLATSAAFTTSAALTIGSNGVPPFPVLGALATVAALFGGGRRAVARFRHPALPLLGTLFVWSAVITALAPAVFAGMPIIAPAGGIDSFESVTVELGFSASMGAQLAYLASGVGVVFYLSQRRALSPSLITVSLAWGTFLSAIRLVPGTASQLDPLFRNSVSAWYNAYETRHAGIYAEPSYLGVFSVIALAFAVYRLRASRGFERITVIGIIALAPVNLLASYSGVGALGLFLLLGLGGVYYLSRFLFARMRLSPYLALLALGIVALLVTPNPFTRALSAVIRGKEGTQSLANRSGSDLFSLEIVAKTWGLGVGLGASRPSSFAALVLSNVGIVGFGLLAAAILVTLLRVQRTPEWLPGAVALISLVILKVIAEPALSTPLLWLLIGGCVYAGRQGGAIRSHDTPPPNRESTHRGPDGDSLHFVPASRLRSSRIDSP